MNVRIKFKKVNESIFISHLDLVRTFQRSMKRAKLPMVYSGGFNPHPEMSFAQALGLGISSIGEYMDVKINDDLEPEEIKNKLDKNLPKGIELIDIRQLKDNAKPAMSIVSHGRYNINIRFDGENTTAIKNGFDNFINQSNIYAKKVQFKKNKVTEVDIKPLIKEIGTDITEKNFEIDCIVFSGSAANLKPELIIKAFEEYINIKIIRYKIERTELFVEKGKKLIPLIDVDNIDRMDKGPKN
ncbi:MAG: DUF2344 domain-containing protein [Clostridiales bacterium]|nr:DUF2344 domain-containing protein [Clostridiales bacterium]